MYKLVCVLGVLAAAVLPASATAILFQGVYTSDDEVALLPFTISAGDTVTIESYGYAGGTAPGGIVIPEGGFAPAVFLFDSSGNEIGSDNGGHCATTGADSVTGNCDDPVFTDSLGAGSYTLALTVWDNVPIDSSLSDGFKQTGNPGFTCSEFGSQGEFCDTTYALPLTRTGNYAVAVTAADLVLPGAPEPSTFVLAFFAIALTGIFRRARSSRTTH